MRVPLPLPLDPEVMLIQLSLLEAVQLHPLAAVTLTLPLPLEEMNDSLLGLIE